MSTASAAGALTAPGWGGGVAVGGEAPHRETSLGFFSFDRNPPTPAARPCLRKHLAPDQAPVHRAALGAARQGRSSRAGPSRAEPSTARHEPWATPRASRPGASRGGAHAQCARAAEWATPCLPPPPSTRKWRAGACGGAAVLVASASPTG